MSRINLLLSPLNLFFTYAFVVRKLMFAKTAFNLFEIDFKNIFTLTYNPFQAVGEGEGGVGGLFPKLRTQHVHASPSKVYPAGNFQ